MKRERRRERYAELSEAGVCPRCGKAEPVSGKRLCEPCGEANRLQQRAWRERNRTGRKPGRPRASQAWPSVLSEVSQITRMRFKMEPGKRGGFWAVCEIWSDRTDGYVTLHACRGRSFDEANRKLGLALKGGFLAKVDSGLEPKVRTDVDDYREAPF